MLRPWNAQLWLEHTPGRSLHARLVNQIVRDIQAGRLLPGSSMPGSRALASQLGVNRKTVQLVYEELEAQGWLYSQPRRGTFVAAVLPEHGLSEQDQALVLDNSRKGRPARGLVTRASHGAQHTEVGHRHTNDGTPDVRLLPFEPLSRAYRRALLRAIRQNYLDYGDPRGTPELRQAILGMLAMDRFMPVVPEEICVVRGSQMGIFLSARALDPAKGVIVVEALCYPPARAAFASTGFEVVACPIDEHGLDTTALERLLSRYPVAAVFTTPHHQYPTTVTLSMERRLALLQLSRQHRFAVIEDDYDHEFHYESRPIPPLASLPGSENVIHIGSLSKVFAPGLRLGYLVADSAFVDRVAEEILLVDRQGNAVTELALADLMESGEVRKHIRKARRQYRQRRDCAAKGLKRQFGEQITFALPAGGMALWVNVGSLVDTTALPGLKAAGFHAAVGANGAVHLRFGFGALSEAEISRAIAALAREIA